MIKNNTYNIQSGLLGVSSQLFSVPASNQKKVKIMDSSSKMLDYFERQINAKKIDSRDRLEVRFAIGAAQPGDAIDQDYLSSPISEVIEFQNPSVKKTNKQISLESKEHPGIFVDVQQKNL